MADLDAMGHEAARRYPGWDDRRFREWCAGPIAALSVDDRTVHGFARLVCEGVGRSYLGPLTEPPRTVLDALLRDRLPRWLPEVAAELRPELLVTAWNIGEGLGFEARWLDQYVLARFGALTDPESFADQVAALLQPVLDPVAAVDWTGPARMVILDLRPSDEEFLPGSMQWIGPRVLAVADRRRERTLGVLLTRDGPSVIGPVERVEVYAVGPVPTPQWKRGNVALAGHSVDLPMLYEPHSFAIADGGFLVVSTANSQRLWVVTVGG